ncbi:phosphomutase family protein [Mycobacterium parascrofulaceum ATCC BAA-614]|uniref:Phosphomutase family protein n=1 Tax=Mycobacterium parascrofulaceum ATCC BAA-614 TaxID=525368 RepID=D5P4W4_9MYCO|nr:MULTISPECIES: histidine phosphatase family protein [Mycobacterium]EFG78868.1 phosphomutase family protein [Mycobacterium parascrofulaceum ATCC BAA-614]OCB39572.1 phosphoglycerate mutase [Mycobacterium malmoense]
MTVILLRHGRSSSNTAGVLAGRSEGVDLDDKGRGQAAGLIDRLGDLAIRGLVSSPLLRCRRTIEPLAEALCLDPVIDDRLAEVDYGEWTGRKLAELAGEPLWRVVQAHPSAAVFPGGEGLAQVQARAVAAVREHDRRLAQEYGGEHGGDALWVACTHGDVIKAVVADAYGMHLDSFQRVTADPASVSVIRYTELRPFVVHVNHTGAKLAAALRAGPPPPPDQAQDKGEDKAQDKAQDGAHDKGESKTDGESPAAATEQAAAAVPSGDAVVGGSTD